ncbi:MAG: hypothetical protein ACYDEN_09400 [Acidimicrobiales bacterium]
MDTVELEVFGEPAWTRGWVESTLRGAGFRVKWQDDLAGTAERGDRIDGWLLGPRSAWLELAVRLVSASEGVTAVRRERTGPPASGPRNWDRAMADVRGRREAAFRQTGTLASIGG